MRVRNYIIVLMALILAGCAAAPKGEKIGTVNDLYNGAMDSLQKQDYATAVHTFEELERQYPYSGWATRAQMMVAYTHYHSGELDEAVLAAERFIRLHPGHKELPYMYYLRAMSFYNRVSDVKRDQGHTEDAMAAFEELMQRYPESDYSQDAKLKITLCRDHLAGKEMHVGRWYLAQKRYLAAINRFKNVVDSYETSSQTPEALMRLTEAYLALGVHDEAKRAAAILGHNYPDSDWYAHAYKLLTKEKLAPAGEEKSWFKSLKELL